MSSLARSTECAVESLRYRERRAAMAALKWLLAILGLLLFGSAGALVVYDVYVASQLRRLLKRRSEGRADATTSLPARPLPPVRWQRVAQLALIDRKSVV